MFAPQKGTRSLLRVGHITLARITAGSFGVPMVRGATTFSVFNRTGHAQHYGRVWFIFG
jgi:hypothetical protein